VTRSEKILCAIYAIIAVIALIATWSNNLAFMAQPGGLDLGNWYAALYSNYAAASFMNDLFLLGIAGCVFIVVEGRRLHVRYYWAYILLSGPTAISFTFPLFLIARERAIARQRNAQALS
jgi:hypothetical protein